MPPILLPPPPAGIQTPTDDWTDDPSFDLTLSPSLATVPLHSSPTSSSSSSSRKQTHSRSHSHSSTSSRGSSGIIASPLRHAHIPKLDIGNTRLKSEAEGEKEEMEDGFDYLPDDIPEDDGFEKRGTDKRLSIQSGSSVRSGKVSGMGTMKGKPPALESGLEGFDFPDDLEIDDDEDGDENQGGTIKLPTSTTIKSTKKGMGTISLSGTIIGVGPKGVGTITRLGSSSTPSASSSKLSLGGSKTQFSEVDDFEGFDDDLANIPTLPSSKSLSMNSNSSTGLMLPPLNRLIAPANALDDLDFDFDDELDAIGEDEDQATLKAGATIKALLPPPRTKPSSSSSSITPKPTSRQSMTTSLPPPEDESEMDLVLPLSMTNLTLANASTRPPHSSSSTKHLKPRASTSTIQSDWDSPSSGSGPGSASKHIWDDSPWGKQRPRASETSGTSTSISDHLGTPVRKGRTVEVEVEGEEEGEEMMLGLVLPESGFFEGRREGELNRILDKKRKPTDAFVSPPHEGGVGGRSWGRSRGEGNRTILLDESMEDGLLFEEEELTGHRLRQQKKVRGLNAGGGPGGTIKRGTVIGKEGSGGGGGGGRGSSAAGSWEKAREAGWGRNAPLRSSTPRDRERERSTGGLGLAGVGGGVSVGHRSHSATASGIPGATGNHIGKPLSSSNRDFSSASAMAGFTSRTTSTADRERDTNSQVIRTRTQSMAPPPIPSIPSTPSSRLLRHQKSHYQIPLPPSPSPTQSIHRKQSLASLQDALSSHPVPDLPPPPSSSSTPQKERYHNSTSRLTMGTSSSRAKVRPPISSIFPRSEMTQAYTSHSASSSTSSISGLTRGPPDPRRSTQVHVQSQMVVPLGGKRRGGLEGKKRTWGDGTELEGIEDLEVDEPSSQIPRSGSGGAGGNGIGLGKPSLTRKGDSFGRSTIPPPTAQKPSLDAEKRKKSNGGSVSKRRPRKAAGLIKHLGTVDKKKVVGDMTWNPSTLRWEGNESILRDFDSIPSSTPTSTSAPVRPALITHYTGGIAPLPSSSSSPSTSTPGLSLTASTIRIVGDMKFDPERMCWVSIGDEEPDPFADMADDEDEDMGGGNTITRASGKKLVSVGQGLGVSAGSGWSSRLASESSAGGSVMSWDERVRVREADGPPQFGSGSSGSNFKSREGGEGVEGEVTEELWRECKDAEERHRKEMKGWNGGLGLKNGYKGIELGRDERRDRERREEKRLWEIRYLAMRS